MFIHRHNGAEPAPRALQWGAIALLVALATGAPAPSPAAVVLSDLPSVSEDVALRGDGSTVQLTLEEAIEIALRRNLGLAVERYNRAQAEQRIFQNAGMYDLSFLAETSYSDREQATTSQLQPSSFKSLFGNIGVSQLLPTGGTAAFGWDVTRSETDLQFDLARSFATSPGFSLTQPLLRNLGRLATERSLRISRLDNDISRDTFEISVASTIQQVENAYWALVEAAEQLKVTEESLALAKELHQMNRVRVDVGTLAPLELVQSEAGIATREEEIIRAQGALGDAMDNLRRLLNLPSSDWERGVRTESRPEVNPFAIDVEAAIASARDNRPELRSQRAVIETRRVESEFQRNQRLPRLDASASYGLSGAASKLGDSIEQVTGGDFPGWSVGLTFAVPLRNRSARAAATIAELELAKAEARLAELEQQVLAEVRTAARGVENARKQVDAARASRVLAEKNLDAERKRYENGMSTSFQILEIQEDLASARSREVSAVAAYLRARTEYHRAVGRLLEETGVGIASAG